VSKRQRAEHHETRKVKTSTGFAIDEDSEEEEDIIIDAPASKRRMLGRRLSQSPEQQATAQQFRDSGIHIEAPSDEDLEENLPETFASIFPQSVETEESQHADVPSLPSFLAGKTTKSLLSEVIDCNGKKSWIGPRQKTETISYEQLVAARSTTKAGRAKKSYYGIDIHQLIDDATKDTAKEAKNPQTIQQDIVPTIEEPIMPSKPRRSLMWTEKYRARHFMELVGDDRTHRQVLKWLKAWDPIVFPKGGKIKAPISKRPPGELSDEKSHRKILMLTGPPGLGKTTLAHVCARQAGYEVMEINASDDRSKDVVEGRIRTSVGTETVKTGATVTTKSGKVQKTAHPLCVVVDEVDGVVGGSGASGEGGFVKALINLITLDQKNSTPSASSTSARKKKKGDDFKLMRPLILICNDVYHPSLKPLRQSNLAEIIHVRKPPLDAVVGRMKAVFEKEGIACDGDAVRSLCEATWGVNAAEAKKGREGSGEGDLRGIMVVGEWAAGKLKNSSKSATPRLTRKWVEQHMTGSLSHNGGSARGIGRGGTKEIVHRVFLEGAGFPKITSGNAISNKPTSDQPRTQLGVSELAKRAGMDRLREMVDTSGEVDRIMTEIFSEYPNQPFNDDNILSKPDAAYEWLAFHDKCSSRVYSAQEYELAPYLSQPILACHNLFASPARHHFSNSSGENGSKKWDEEEEEPLPFSGPRADYSAFEAEKANRASIVSLQSSLNPVLQRSFRSPEHIATDLIPYLVRMLTPEVKPIIVGGSGEQKGIASVRNEAERLMVKRAVDVMATVGVAFERGKLEGDFGTRGTQWIYRMEP
jgi:chromosome transmission fidelity protein 18